MLDALNQHSWLLYLCLLSLGLVVGSFLNVVIHRLPIMMESRWRSDCCELLEVEQEKQERPLSLAFPNSHCPSCKANIRAWQNIPVVSYLLTRRCLVIDCEATRLRAIVYHYRMLADHKLPISPTILQVRKDGTMQYTVSHNTKKNASPLLYHMTRER